MDRLGEGVDGNWDMKVAIVVELESLRWYGGDDVTGAIIRPIIHPSNWPRSGLD